MQRGNDALTGPPILPFHSVLYVPAWCACIQNLSLICMKTSIIGAHTFVFGEICGLIGGLKTRPFGVSSAAVDLHIFGHSTNMAFNIRGGHSPISVGVPSLWTVHNGVQFQSIHGNSDSINKVFYKTLCRMLIFSPELHINKYVRF